MTFLIIYLTKTSIDVYSGKKLVHLWSQKLVLPPLADITSFRLVFDIDLGNMLALLHAKFPQLQNICEFSCTNCLFQFMDFTRQGHKPYIFSFWVIPGKFVSELQAIIMFKGPFLVKLKPFDRWPYILTEFDIMHNSQLI